MVKLGDIASVDRGAREPQSSIAFANGKPSVLVGILAQDGVQIIKFEEQQLLEDTVPDMIEEWIKEMAKIGKEEQAKAYAAEVRQALGL